MSGSSGESNNSSEVNFILGNLASNISSKPNTTENNISQLSYQDEVLRDQKTSSKPFLNAISSLDSSQIIDNGILESNSQSLPEVPFPTEALEANTSTTGNDAQVSTENPPIQEAPEKKPCLFHQKHGFCRYGKKCRYEHFRPMRMATKDTRADLNNDSGAVKNANSETKANQVCYFFSRNYRCRYGDNCRFIHQEGTFSSEGFSSENNRASMETTLKENSEDTKENRPSLSEHDAELSQHFNLYGEEKNFEDQKIICRSYFSSGKCRFGARCRFVHVKRSIPELQGNTDEKQIQPENADLSLNNDHQLNDTTENHFDKKRSIVKRPGQLRSKKASDMTAEDFQKLRQTEIKQFKKRFPSSVRTSSEENVIIEMEFVSSDPDWRFDVKSLNLRVLIPKMYPQEAMEIEVLNPDCILPDKLTRYLNKSISAWLKIQQEMNLTNDNVVLIFRPFINWFDKTLEDMFISGLKMVKRDMEAQAAGIEFVTHEELNKPKNTTPKGKDDSPPQKQEPTPSPYELESQEAEEPMPAFLENVDSQSLLVDQTVDERAMQETPRRGTEVKLRNLELLEGAATLTCRKLSLTVQCGRCKMRNDITAAPHRNHKIACERCHHQQKLAFRPQMLHSFSSVLGYLDLESCEVIDVPLLTCEFALQCLPCGRQNLLTSLQYGQKQTSWCLFCNTKMIVFVESIKLNQLQPNIEAVAALGAILKIEKKEKRVKDPIIQEGKPLPENGTCKHYKKSFRWLRFPCCGKAYPCDHCHDEKEADHDMKYATRMICGFCAKEQPYGNDRPCVLCSSSLTKKTGSHWEGGKGCRDKIKMSKEDQQKYAGCNKTVSRKAQAAK